ncbi:MAG: phosphate acyltransferase PlsX [Pseudomonadota bacterium]|nr:phosphate acyltransferase PlsX [Pseudomonadota bacterium]
MASLILSVDAMGGDAAPTVVLDGLKLFAAERSNVMFEVHGRAEDITPGIESRGLMERCTIFHHDDVVAMSEKPSAALRRAKTTSMWGAVQSVKAGRAGAAVSAGNTGALMAFSMMSLRKMEGVHRPAMTAIWPTIEGRSVVLDVGANLDADSDQLVTFAIMGEAYARAVTGKTKPTIGLLNIGSEDEKGRDTLKLAAERLRESELGLDFRGYVEGNDIAMGAVDVVVTDGFTGNVALKTAEGTARLVASYVREALTSGVISKVGAALASSGLKRLKEKMDPSNVNGGVLLGLNGVVVKSHGGTDAEGYATAVKLAADLAGSRYMEEVAAGLSRDRVEVSLSEVSE